MERVSICLSDLPKEAITTGKNGKKYVSIIVDKRKESDQFGNDLTVYLSQSEEERKSKKEKKYVGNGKTYNFQKKEDIQEVQVEVIEPNDLPF